MAYMAPVSGKREYVHVNKCDITAVKAAWILERYCSAHNGCEKCVFNRADEEECMFQNGDNPAWWEIGEWEKNGAAFYDDEKEKRFFSFKDLDE